MRHPFIPDTHEYRMLPTQAELEERQQGCWNEVIADGERDRQTRMSPSKHTTKAKLQATQLGLKVDVSHITTAFQIKTPTTAAATSMDTATASYDTNLPTILETEMDTPAWVETPSKNSNPRPFQPYTASEYSTQPQQNDSSDYSSRSPVQQTNVSNVSSHTSPRPSISLNHSHQQSNHPNNAFDYSSRHTTHLNSLSEDSVHSPNYIDNASDDGICSHLDATSDNRGLPVRSPNYPHDASDDSIRPHLDKPSDNGGLPTLYTNHLECPCGDPECAVTTATGDLQDLSEIAANHPTPEIFADQICRALPGCTCKVCTTQWKEGEKSAHMSWVQAQIMEAVRRTSTQAPLQYTSSTPSRRHSFMSAIRSPRTQPKRAPSLDLIQHSRNLSDASTVSLPRGPRDKNAMPIVHRSGSMKPLPPLPTDRSRFPAAAGDFMAIRKQLERIGMDVGGTTMPNRALQDRESIEERNWGRRFSYLESGNGERPAVEAIHQGSGGEGARLPGWIRARWSRLRGLVRGLGLPKRPVNV